MIFVRLMAYHKAFIMLGVISFLLMFLDVFEVDKKNGKEQRILRENAKLKQSLAETILELKKSKRVGKG